MPIKVARTTEALGSHQRSIKDEEYHNNQGGGTAGEEQPGRLIEQSDEDGNVEARNGDNMGHPRSAKILTQGTRHTTVVAQKDACQ